MKKITIVILASLVIIVIPVAMKSSVLIKAHKDKAVCIAQLRKLELAEDWVAVNYSLGPRDLVDTNAVAQYFEGHILPQCPAGGTYSIGAYSEPPTCSLGNSVNDPEPFHRLVIEE